MAEYDKIAERYVKLSKYMIARKFVFVPSFLYFVGDVKGKKVLDLACGDGFFSRLIKKKGASEVVGVDVSKEMIKLAKKEEKKRLLGIKYYIFDVSKMPKIGEFDLVTAAWLLHYSKNKKQLFEMCKNIAKNLKKDGVFVTINNNPFNPLQLNPKYGYTVTSNKKTLKEGDKLTVTFFKNNEALFSFHNYFWKKETYGKALEKAGFKKIEWHKVFVSKEGIKKFGKKFWKEFKSSSVIIKCKKE